MDYASGKEFTDWIDAKLKTFVKPSKPQDAIRNWVINTLTDKESRFRISNNGKQIEIGEGTGYRFLPTKNTAYDYLTTEDKEVLDAVLKRFGKATKKEIVETMHKEDAYTETAPSDIIQFKYAKTLSLA